MELLLMGFLSLSLCFASFPTSLLTSPTDSPFFSLLFHYLHPLLSLFLAQFISLISLRSERRRREERKMGEGRGHMIRIILAGW